MKYFLAILMTTALAFGQQPALKEQALSAIKATILVPEGWNVREESEDGVTVYQITREKAEAEGDPFSAGLILSVTTKVPDRASMKPSEYSNDLLTSAQEEGDGPAVEKTTEGPLQCLRAEYTIESDDGDIKVVNLAKANDTTGTLYFATWQSPAKEETTLKELRENVLSSLKIDPSY
ncbi:MAG TPA: hypothetical protein VIT18_05230 [Terrimicrobiaceae bacterium]